jgi:hypothetical protein
MPHTISFPTSAAGGALGSDRIVAAAWIFRTDGKKFFRRLCRRRLVPVGYAGKNEIETMQARAVNATRKTATGILSCPATLRKHVPESGKSRLLTGTHSAPIGRPVACPERRSTLIDDSK